MPAVQCAAQYTCIHLYPDAQVLKRAFTTDCSYTEDPQIPIDNTYTSKIWDLERLHEKGIDGAGITIAVIDSGINYMSPAFKDNFEISLKTQSMTLTVPLILTMHGKSVSG